MTLLVQLLMALWDEVTIFNGALSDQDIMDLYNAQSMAPVVPPGMVANYAFSNNATDGTFLQQPRRRNRCQSNCRPLRFWKQPMSSMA